GMTQMIHAPTFSKNTVPQINVSGYTQLFALANSNLYSWNTYNQWNLAPSLTLTRGRHALRAGFEFNYVARGDENLGNSNGTFTFDTFWTRQLTDRSQGTFDGSSVASLLLGTPWGQTPAGAPNGGYIDWNDNTYRSRPYYAFYVQDDWKISP